MRELSFYFSTVNRYSDPVTEQDFLLRCLPQERPEQEITEFDLRVTPRVTGATFGRDSFGNTTYHGRIPEPHTEFTFTISGKAIRDESRRRIELFPLPCYRYPSALTRPSETLRNLLRSIPEDPDPLREVDLLRVAVHASLEYRSGVTNVSTTASEALEGGQGVCQDFTHVFIALCRMRGLPARYVSGLPLGEGASHAWAEVWCSGLWRGVDATRDCAADDNYLKFCTGRDFSDCPIEQGVFRGACKQSQSVWTSLKVAEQ
ncbi:MAG: transglutaminase family protein [Sutterellaceae bacterium]|nr:transglutaminase family protein [Sutterellaceae bacterium]